MTTIIHYPPQELHDAVLIKLERQGFLWNDDAPRKPTDENFWNEYE